MHMSCGITARTSHTTGMFGGAASFVAFAGAGVAACLILGRFCCRWRGRSRACVGALCSFVSACFPATPCCPPACSYRAHEIIHSVMNGTAVPLC